MRKKRWWMAVLVVCVALLLGGCQKTAVRDDTALREAEKMAATEKERADRLEQEKRDREARELARLKEEEARRAQAEKELEAERVARLEAERAIRERELKAREEAARRALAEKELQAAREREARLEAEKAIRERELKAREEAARRALAKKQKEFEKSLVAKRYPGIEGEVYESTRFKDVHFDYDKYDIRPEDVRTLEDTAAVLLDNMSVKIQIEGHCDERGTAEYNLALGERRANSVKQYLVSLGVADDRISSISFGEEKPLDPGHHEEAYAKNRRAHFVILSK